MARRRKPRYEDIPEEFLEQLSIMNAWDGDVPEKTAVALYSAYEELGLDFNTIRMVSYKTLDPKSVGYILELYQEKKIDYFDAAFYAKGGFKEDAIDYFIKIRKREIPLVVIEDAFKKYNKRDAKAFLDACASGEYERMFTNTMREIKYAAMAAEQELRKKFKDKVDTIRFKSDNQVVSFYDYFHKFEGYHEDYADQHITNDGFVFKNLEFSRGRFVLRDIPLSIFELYIGYGDEDPSYYYDDQWYIIPECGGPTWYGKQIYLDNNSAWKSLSKYLVKEASVVINNQIRKHKKR